MTRVRAFARGLALISRKLLRVFVRFHVVLFPEKIAEAGDPSSTLRAVRLASRRRFLLGARRKNKKEPKTALTFQSGINLIEKTRLRASLRPVKSPDSRNSVREPGKTSPIRPAGTSFGEKPTKYTRRVR